MKLRSLHEIRMLKRRPVASTAISLDAELAVPPGSFSLHRLPKMRILVRLLATLSLAQYSHYKANAYLSTLNGSHFL